MIITELVEHFFEQMKVLIKSDNPNTYPLQEVELSDEYFTVQYPYENQAKWCKYHFVLDAFAGEIPSMTDAKEWQILSSAAELAMFRLFPLGYDMTGISQVPNTGTFIFEGYVRTR